MLITRPQRLRIMPGRTCWMQRKEPSKLIRSTASQSAGFIRTAKPSRVMPALFTSTSTRPLTFSARPKASLIDSGERRSRSTAINSHPEPRIASANSGLDSMVVAAATTSNPERQSARAIDRPIPRLAPVTNATRLDMRLCRHDRGVVAGGGQVLDEFAVDEIVGEAHLDFAYVIEFKQLLGSECQAGCREVVLELVHPARADNRKRVLRKHPGDRHLSGRAAQFARHVLHRGYDRVPAGVLPVALLHHRSVETGIAGRLPAFGVFAGQQSTGQWRPGGNADAQGARHRD